MQPAAVLKAATPWRRINGPILALPRIGNRTVALRWPRPSSVSKFSAAPASAAAIAAWRVTASGKTPAWYVDCLCGLCHGQPVGDRLAPTCHGVASSRRSNTHILRIEKRDTTRPLMTKCDKAGQGLTS
jgi:hypothetical protein